MKTSIIAALLAAQFTMCAQPALAAELVREGASAPGRAGAFAGARLRVPLGGGRDKPTAGLALTSTLRSGTSGELRFARGAELGFSGSDAPIRLTLAGAPVSRLVQGRTAPEGRRQGVSTLGWVAIGVGAVVLVVVVASAICLSDDDCIPSE
jgi:hypothetical protein